RALSRPPALSRLDSGPWSRDNCRVNGPVRISDGVWNRRFTFTPLLKAARSKPGVPRFASRQEATDYRRAQARTASFAAFGDTERNRTNNSKLRSCVIQGSRTIGHKMYCPDCGDYSTQGLNFCKHCGAALSSLDGGSDVEPRSRPNWFVWAMALFTILIGFAGLAVIFGMSFVMAQNPTVDKDYPIALVAFGSLSFVGVLAVLVYMLLRLSGA